MNTIETAALAELNAMIDAAQAKTDALVAKLDALEKKIENREKRVAPYARKRKVSPVARRSAQPKNRTRKTPTMKTTYTVKTRSGFRHLTNKREALRIARIEKSDGWPTFVKAGGQVIFSFDRKPQPGLV
jgi:uncharacterized coiled-coil protein SlyX